MDNDMILLAIIIVLVAFYVYVNSYCVENFTSTREKAQNIVEETYPMFRDNEHSFDKYKEKFPSADAVEYVDVRKKYREGDFTADSIEQVL